MGRISGTRKKTRKADEQKTPSRRRAKAPEVLGPEESIPPLSEDMIISEEPSADEGLGVGKLILPPSGLAADILAREEAHAVDLSAPRGSSDIEAAVPPITHVPTHGDTLAFFAPSAREEKKVVEATEQLVTFFLADEEYGLDVRLVQEIIRVGEVTLVPRAPHYVKGVLNLRGRVIPVVDLKRKLNLGEVDAESRLARIVVAKVRDRLIGLLVDGVSQVLKVPVSIIEPAPEEVVPVDTNYIRGVAKMDKRLIILMELSKVLSLDPNETKA
jgi:purine-binding chemotaxis protein CheW